MPKKSSKSKSKRTTLKQKYKVIKKVKEHGRKVRKEARKSGKKKKAPADPGLPKQWPFKQELIAELEEKRRLILEAEAAKKAERKRAREAARSEADEDMGEVPTLENLQAEADGKQAAYAQQQKRQRREAAAAAAQPGQAQERSRRAFYKEFVRLVEAADVVLEVLDARDPLAYRCREVEQFIRAADPNKKILLLLNKIDLVPRAVAERWLAYLRAELPTLAFKCSTQRQAQHLGAGKRAIPGGRGAKGKVAARGGAGGDKVEQAGSESLGVDSLLQLLKNYARNADMKTAITVGIVGLPNVGKSSLINSLKRSRAVSVGNTPGVTTTVQEVHLDKHIKLLDSPGIVFSAGASAAASALRNCIKVEQLADPALPVAEIVAKCPREQLMAVYSIPAFAHSDQFLQLVAAARGKLGKGGTVNVDAAARTVLSDWNDGRIPYYTEPPERKADAHAGAAIVGDWGAEFSADQLDQSAVLAGLRPAEDGTHFAAPSAGAAAAVDLAGMASEAAQFPAAGEPDAMASSDDEEDGAGAGGDAMDETDGPQPSPAGAQQQQQQQPRSKATQTEVLYSEEGQYNPKAARSERKQAKRQKKVAAAAAAQGDGSGSDFDLDDL